jgi:integrase
MASIRRRCWITAQGEQRVAWQTDVTDQHGKRHQLQFARRKDADAWLVQARARVAAGTFTPDATSITIGQAAELWLARCARDGLEMATLKQYRSHVAHHIEPLLGSTKLSRLTTPIAEQFVDDMLVGGRSRALSKKVLASLKAVIKEAQRRGLVAQNVASGVTVKIAKRHKQKVEIPSKAEIKAEIDGATGRKRALLVTAVFTGLRASELRGLRWQDVDFGNRVVRVRQRANMGGRLGPLKSGSSRRDIPMAPMVINALKQWKLACPESELDLVFPGRSGGVTCHTTLWNAHGRLHRFRHFFASWLIDQGFGPKRVQTLVGHASIQQTYDGYGHLFPQEDDYERFAAGELALIG